MKFIPGTPRGQAILFPQCLDEIISADNPVRNIDAFVENLDLSAMGFDTNKAEEGRPAYHPAVLLKIFLYGYMNRTRSSRNLEKECHRNIEMMWLTEQRAPDHNTINKFRKNNSKSIKKVFRATVEIAKNHDLIGGALVAGDSTKLRAQNSKKNNFNPKKINRHLAYIDNKLDQYNKVLDDEESTEQERQEAQGQVQKHSERKKGYERLGERLKASKEKQISTSDPDSRHLPIRGNITEVAYSVQTVTDSRNKIPVDFEVTNENDRNAMGKMVKNTKSVLGHNNFIALFDKGYHTGAELEKAAVLGIDVLVAIPKIGRASQAPNPEYNAEHFVYHPKTDAYTCPENQTLTSNGNWYKGSSARFKQYKAKACSKCPVKAQCTAAKTNGKTVQRSEHKQYVEDNAQRVAQNKEIYRSRQAIVEHPFGTIKRNWGFDHIMPKKYLHRASADVGLIFTAYNLKRIFNILKEQGAQCANLLKIAVLESFCAITCPLVFQKPVLYMKKRVAQKGLGSLKILNFNP